jgi:hypothetical protein
MNGFSSFRMIQQINAEDLLKAELLAVQNESEKKFQKLRFAHDTHIGLELLHTFVLDLLGRNTPVAKIFRTKSEEEYDSPFSLPSLPSAASLHSFVSLSPARSLVRSFRHSMVVSTGVKVIAWIVVILINFFFVFFSILRGLERGADWQRLFLMACIFR